jgi:PAS domain S-box-containing protein
MILSWMESDSPKSSTAVTETDGIPPTVADLQRLDGRDEYEWLVHSIDGILWELDYVNWNFTFVSKQAEDILGYPIERWMTDPDFWLSSLHPDDREWVFNSCKEASERGEDHQFVYRMIAADGRVVWLRDIVTVEMSEGRPVRLRGVMVDITARKKEEALRTGQNRVLEMIATGAQLPDILTSLVRLIESQSEGLCSILLLDDDGVTIRPIAAPSLPEEYNKALDSVRIGPRAGSCGTAVYLGKPVIVTDIRTDPLWKDYRALAEPYGLRACWSTPILSHQGKVLGSFAVYYREPRAPRPDETRLTDIAAHVAGIAIDRQLAEEALRQSEARYRNVVETQSELICRYLSDTTLTFVNEAYCRFFGRTSEELIGTKFIELIPEAWRENSLSHVASIIANPRREAHEHEVLKPDGSIGWHQWIDHAILDASGNVIELQGIGRDITERRRAEEALRQREDELRWSHRQIRELAGRLMTAHEEERRRISRELHDDLNQKVAALAINLSWIKRQLPPSADAVVAQLDKVQNRAKELADGIRQLSHELHPAALEHSGLATALRSFVDEFSRHEEIDVSLTIPDRGEAIPQEIALCLYRIAQESLRNVAKHSGAKTAAVTLLLEDGIARVKVEDGGRGFDPDLVRRSGGLGLVSMEERVRLMQGSFQVSARPDGGTSLLASIPLKRE